MLREDHSVLQQTIQLVLFRLVAVYSGSQFFRRMVYAGLEAQGRHASLNK